MKKGCRIYICEDDLQEPFVFNTLKEAITSINDEGAWLQQENYVYEFTLTKKYVPEYNISLKEEK